MNEDSRAAFPPTRWTLLRTAADPAAPEARASLEALTSAYWPPVYAYLRSRWRRSREEAEDLAQDFFATLAERDVLSRLAPAHGSFRSYVKAALDNFARQDHARASREKRGGGVAHVPLDDQELSLEGTPEEVFDREWARAVLADALEELRAASETPSFEIFVLRDVEAAGDASYESLARRFGVAESDVTNYLYRARKKFREIVLKRVCDTLTDSREAEEEIRRLFGGPA